MARVLPADTAHGFPINQLVDMLDKGPPLSAPEWQAIAEDMAAVRANLATRGNPGGS